MRRSWIFAAVLLAACSDDPKQPQVEVRPVPAVDRAALMTHVGRLAHDSMRGRGSGTAHELRAAQYITSEFASYGLEAPGLMVFAVPPARVGGQTEVSSQNVLGTVPGTGTLRNEWIVIGAHYDHVGERAVVGGGTSIYNGADDNASGTAVVLELARLFAKHAREGGFGDEPRRSLLFMAFGAEELGLIGSEHYCAQPMFPMMSVAAMLNFDMVGRMRDRTVGVGGLQTAAEWTSLLAQKNTDALVLAANDCTACTDHACFRRAQRPVLWFFTGFHDQYHQPGDDTELINQEGLGMVSDLAARVIADLAQRPTAPRFVN